MRKKLIPILLILALVVSLMPMMPVLAVEPRATLTVTADKQEVNPGDTINYTIKVKTTGPICSIYTELGIPEGLTYVANSGKLDSNFVNQMGDIAEIDYTEETRRITVLDLDPLNISGEITVATFKCTVNENTTSGNYTVELRDTEFANENMDALPASEFSSVNSTIKVSVPATGISLNKTTLTLDAGKTDTLVATVEPATADQGVIWESEDSSTVSVVNGVVTALKTTNEPVTITVYTLDKTHSATCEVTVVCAHENTTKHEAVPSTCMVQGNGEYVTCDDCGEVISGTNAKLPLADHSYGKLIEKVDAIHTADELKDGVDAHYKCSVCGKLFDENKQEATEEDLVIKAAHQYGEWEADTEDHWKECGCGNIVDQEAHKGGTATCTEKAKCEVCGAEYGEVDSSNHVNTETRNAVEATCIKEGYTGDLYCKDCGIELQKGTVIPLAEHKGGTATCVEKAKCMVCGAEYGEINPLMHANTELRDAVEATTETEGYTGDLYCLDCQRVVRQGEVIPVKTVEQEETAVTDETETVAEENKESTDATKPKTGDNSNITLWISLLVISGICFIGIAKCKTKRNISKHSK